MKAFLEFVEQQREMRGLPRQEFLLKAKISRRTWNRWLAGVSRPQRSSAFKISKALGLTDEEDAQLDACLMRSNGSHPGRLLASLESRLASLERRLEKVDKAVARMAKSRGMRVTPE